NNHTTSFAYHARGWVVTSNPASRRKLVDRAIIRRPTVHGCPIEVPRGISHHSVVGQACARRAGEAIGHTLRRRVVASRSQFEDDAVTCSPATVTRGAIQVARGVADESTDGTASVGCAF